MRSRWIGLVLAALGGCTLTTSLDGLSDGANPVTADAGGLPEGAVDASEDVAVIDGGDAGDATADAGSNLYPSGDFESGDTCSGESYNSNLTLSAQNPHGGLASCKLCGRSSTAPTFSFDQNIPHEPVVVGRPYRATAWVRRSYADPAPTDVVSLVVRTFVQSAGFAVVENSKVDITLGAGWKFVSVDFTPTKPAEAFDVFVSANYESGTCFVVDDITFVRLP